MFARVAKPRWIELCKNVSRMHQIARSLPKKFPGVTPPAVMYLLLRPATGRKGKEKERTGRTVGEGPLFEHVVAPVTPPIIECAVRRFC